MASSSESVRWRADPLDLLDVAVAGLGGEQRDGQRTLTKAVADAIGRGCHLVAEAPTGSGKSLAYLVPAIASGLKVVVATSTIALQGQLVSKDLPALQHDVSVPFTFALLKGRSNYLCLAKLREAGNSDALFEQPVGAAFPQELERLRSFAKESGTGDRADFDGEVARASWAAVTCASVECPGKANCADGGACFAERARDRAREASILVVNHALYCTHLASEGAVLPEHDLVVIDEAHAFPENATNVFASEVVGEELVRLAGMLGRAGAERPQVDALTQAGGSLASVIEAREGTVVVEEDADLRAALLGAAERLAAASVGITKGDEYAKRVARISSGRLAVLRRLAAPEAGDVVWAETAGRRGRLRVAPVNPAEMIGPRLLDQRVVIAVSATLGGGPPFAAVASQMGFSPTAAPGQWHERVEDRMTSRAGRGYLPLHTPSSFDWKQQGILYVGKDLPDPGRDRSGWMEQAADRLCRLVNAAGGRALVLCTSRANVAHFAEVLRSRTDHRVLSQGDGDAAVLARAFIDDDESVLVGTRSFWAGFDAPGTTCVLVVIDRIPFPVPDEPMHAARRQRAADRGLDSFAAVDLPAAALVLAQGAGRLIRRRDDRGVVAVFDSRLANRGYRLQLLAALPPFRRSIDLEETCAFLRIAGGRVARSRSDGVDDCDGPATDG